MNAGSGQDIVSESVWTALRSFAIDKVTAEVMAGLADDGIDSILLKGPTIAAWLYAHERPRLYKDSDLLIQQPDWGRAQEVMRGMGFHDALGPLAHPRMESGSSHPWRRDADGAEVDLHYTLFGLTAPPARVWATFSGSSMYQAVGGSDVRVLGRPARLLHIALHAVQHGGERQAKPMIDLELALAVAEPADWNSAAELARALGAVDAFIAGLGLLPRGSAIVERSGLSSDGSLGASLRLDTTPMAEGFEQLARTPGIRSKLSLLIHEAVPNAEFMRWWHPLARRGRLGLAAAYGWRVLWLAGHALPGFIGWRRARRAKAHRSQSE